MYVTRLLDAYTHQPVTGAMTVVAHARAGLLQVDASMARRLQGRIVRLSHVEANSAEVRPLPEAFLELISPTLASNKVHPPSEHMLSSVYAFASTGVAFRLLSVRPRVLHKAYANVLTTLVVFDVNVTADVGRGNLVLPTMLYVSPASEWHTSVRQTVLDLLLVACDNAWFGGLRTAREPSKEGIAAFRLLFDSVVHCT